MINVGEFTTKSSRLRVTDPCYDKDTWCAGFVDNCVTGVWEAFVEMKDCADWGNRVARLLVRSKTETPVGEYVETDIDVGVDSGQAGVFDDEQFKRDMRIPHKLTGNREYYRHSYVNDVKEAKERAEAAAGTMMADDFNRMLERSIRVLAQFDEEEPRSETDFYEVCCDKTLGNKRAGTVEYGAVSSSGFGDGSYDASVKLNSAGQVCEIMIDFHVDDEEDETPDIGF